MAFEATNTKHDAGMILTSPTPGAHPVGVYPGFVVQHQQQQQQPPAQIYPGQAVPVYSGAAAPAPVAPVAPVWYPASITRVPPGWSNHSWRAVQAFVIIGLFFAIAGLTVGLAVGKKTYCNDNHNRCWDFQLGWIIGGPIAAIGLFCCLVSLFQGWAKQREFQRKASVSATV
eukprot:TRINITY_DN5022_c0_g1_i1.p1 TRINITY_DN5022_c0_g1~~TRINITY_DN5022_c0_g1_i1.p1  ORF type:complete len:172 (-),score=39.22 TRINITY_DN5022_c0_g1_i1:253-768(-)